MPADRSNMTRIAIVGFGEAGRAFASGWDLRDSGLVSAFDIKTTMPSEAEGMIRAYSEAGVRGAATLAEALRGARLVFCVVTADQAIAAAEAAAPAIGRDTIWLDCNSCAPMTKQAAAEIVEAAGASYVDVAVMAPVSANRHRTSLLLSGKTAPMAAELLAALDMRPSVIGARVGEASAVKMMRSVVIKGIEALTAECLLAARRAGVEDKVIASLQASDPGFDWRARSAYNLDRMMLHGARRAAEMREVAKTLAAYGLPNRMSEACARWQDEIAALSLPPGEPDLGERADRILERITPRSG